MLIGGAEQRHRGQPRAGRRVGRQVRRGGTGMAASAWSQGPGLGPSLSQCPRPNATGDEQKQASPRRNLLPQTSLHPGPKDTDSQHLAARAGSEEGTLGLTCDSRRHRPVPSSSPQSNPEACSSPAPVPGPCLPLPIGLAPGLSPSFPGCGVLLQLFSREPPCPHEGGRPPLSAHLQPVSPACSPSPTVSVRSSFICHRTFFLSLGLFYQGHLWHLEGT